jgi:23S rRNA (guanosine2251-2'-O)-methyltransferase
MRRQAKGTGPSGRSGMARPAKGKAPAKGGMARPARAGGPAKGGMARPAKGKAPAKGGMARTVKGSAGRRGAAAQIHPASTRERGLGGEQVEGRQAVRELLLAGRRKVRELWVATDLDDAGVIADILDLAADQRVPVVEVNRRKLDAEARSEAPQGVLAKAQPLEEYDLDDLLARQPGRPPFLLAVDGVTDPGNLGALLRSAEGAGVTGVLLPRHRAVHITPTAAKAAAGAIEHLRMTVVGGLPAALQQVKAKGIWVVGLDDAADRTLFELGDLGREGVCLVLGAEGAGLGRLVRERCDLIVAIPMLGRLSSLNVSAAGALACYEVARQRA